MSKSVETSFQKQFNVKWKNGGDELLTGNTIREALNNGGYQTVKLTAIESYTAVYDRNMVKNRVVTTTPITATIPSSRNNDPEKTDEANPVVEKSTKNKSGEMIETAIMTLIASNPNGIIMKEVKNAVLEGINKDTWNSIIYKLIRLNKIKYDKESKIITQ